eukprot:6843248-Alexandrium_andersonii.AAC.1
MEPDPIAPRPSAASAVTDPLWLCNPLDPDENLGGRVDTAELRRIRTALAQGDAEVRHGHLWWHRKGSWGYIEHVRYGEPGRRPGEVVKPWLPMKAPPPMHPALPNSCGTVPPL